MKLLFFTVCLMGGLFAYQRAHQKPEVILRAPVNCGQYPQAEIQSMFDTMDNIVRQGGNRATAEEAKAKLLRAGQSGMTIEGLYVTLDF